MTVADGGVDWMSTWWIWLGVVPGPLLFLRRDRMAAGADWLRTGSGRALRTYELSSVKVSGDRTGVSWVLTLRDSSGVTVSKTLLELQQQTDLWDLVYNGICHSIANGATTNTRAWRHLKLPQRLRQHVDAMPPPAAAITPSSEALEPDL